MSKVVLDLKGMSCASCALTIEKALNKAEDLKAVVNFAIERATIEGDNLDPDRLIGIVKGTGYDASLYKVEEEKVATKKTYRVKGMTCASCAATVEKSLNKVPGVKEASVNIATEAATVIIDPNVVSEREMAKAVENSGYELVLSHEKKKAEEDTYYDKVKDARVRMIWAWVITAPLALVMILDMTSIIRIPYFNWISVLVSFPVIFIIGYPVIRSAFVALVHRGTNMDVLIMLGVAASYLTGILALAGMNIADYSAVGAMIMGFNLIGTFLETEAKGKASEAIKKLLQMSVKTAHILDENGKEIEIAVESLAVGDTMIVKPSEKIPTDGVILEGDTTIDESMATGESMPVRRTVGSEVIGSTVNQMGFLKVRVTNVGDDTFLSQVVKLVEEAQGTKVPIQALADKVVGIFVPVVLLIAAGVFLFWLLDATAGHRIMLWASAFIPWVNPNLGVLSSAIFASVATLVIACPCALGLATPTALMVGSGMGASQGILIRSGEALQTAKDVDTVVFDKTGTITTGAPHVTDVKTASESALGEEDFLRTVGIIENYSEHPLGRAIVDYAEAKSIDVKSGKVSGLTVQPGLGIEGNLDGKKIYVGSLRMAAEKGAAIPDEIENYGKEGKTVIVGFEEGGKYLGMIALSDTIRTEARDAVNELKNMGIKTVMLTGDNRFTAEAVAKELDISEVRYELLPSDKIEEIKKLQSESRIVAMVGDGINDAPSLKQANIGIAIGTGTDIAKEASDITLVKGDLIGVVKAIRLSKATFVKILQNLFWAFFYNVVAIPVAGLGLLHPIIAEIAMALSSVNVVTNSLRLKKHSLG